MNKTMEDYHDVWESLYRYFKAKGYNVTLDGWKITAGQARNAVTIETKMEVVGGEKTSEKTYTMKTEWETTFSVTGETSALFAKRIQDDFDYFFEHLWDKKEPEA